MSTIPSPPPVRQTAGAGTDFPWGPLADLGVQNPFFYHVDKDDFDSNILIAASGTQRAWTSTLNANGTIAGTAGDGGLALFTTNSSSPLATDLVQIQRPVANWTLTLGKKLFFLARLQLADVVNAGLLLGLSPTASNIVTTAVDGIFFYKAAGATTLKLIHNLAGTVASPTLSVTIPTASNTLANTVNIDLGFYLDADGVIHGFVSPNMVGWQAQSGQGSIIPTRGACVAITPTTLTTAALNFGVGIVSGTTASTTMTLDFIMAAKER